MKTASILILTLLVSCATTQEGKIIQVHDLSYAAASTGTQAALRQNATWRNQFEQAFKTLDVLVETKTVTGALLREIMAQLPVNELKSENARLAIESATVLYDLTVGNKVNIEAQPYVLASATGIRHGLRAALGKTP